MRNPDMTLQQIEDLAGHIYLLCDDLDLSNPSSAENALTKIHQKSDSIRKQAAGLRYSGALAKFKETEWGFRS